MTKLRAHGIALGTTNAVTLRVHEIKADIAAAATRLRVHGAALQVSQAVGLRVHEVRLATDGAGPRLRVHGIQADNTGGAADNRLRVHSVALGSSNRVLSVWRDGAWVTATERVRRNGAWV